MRCASWRCALGVAAWLRRTVKGMAVQDWYERACGLAKPPRRLVHRLPMYAAQQREPLLVAERLECEIRKLPSGYAVARESGEIR